jgi:hypothetical protein
MLNSSRPTVSFVTVNNRIFRAFAGPGSTLRDVIPSLLARVGDVIPSMYILFSNGGRAVDVVVVVLVVDVVFVINVGVVGVVVTVVVRRSTSPLRGSTGPSSGRTLVIVFASLVFIVVAVVVLLFECFAAFA